MYPQFNDASLPWGGSINAHPDSLLPIAGSTATVDDVLAPHRSHALGVDIDISVCYSTDQGVDDHQSSRIRWTSEGCLDSDNVAHPELEVRRSETVLAMKLFGDAALHGRNGNHFHVRFRGIS